MTKLSSKSAIVALALGLSAASGCTTSPPADFYVLSYDAGGGKGAATTTMREGVALGVGPVSLPKYLDRPQIVTRDSDNQLDLAEFDQWGGNLQDNFTLVLAEVLSSDLSTDRVSIYPWQSSVPVDYQISVQVNAFERNAAGESILDARWSVLDGKSQKVLSMGRSIYRQPATAGTGPGATKPDYDAIAAAMSRSIALLGQDIADRIASLPTG
jgi:uncharacterized lipoprotein YmbA